MTEIPKIPAAKLGQAGLVPLQGLGLMGLSDFYGTQGHLRSEETEAAAMRLIEILIEASAPNRAFLDTADMYGYGLNERLLGKAIKKFGREKFFVATKFSIKRDEKGAWLGISGDPKYVHEACNASLERLGIETIDLYYQHRKDPNVPIEETVKAMVQLKEQGKIRYLGLSEASEETIRRAHAVHPISALQTEYSLWTTDTKPKIDLCKELGIAFVAYSPLGRGFLTGQIKSLNDLAPDDYRRLTPRFQGENFAKNLELVKDIEKIAQKYNCTPGQLALAWVHAHGDHVFTIPGTKREKYLLENLGAMKIKISKEDMDVIQDKLDKFEVAGLRYPAQSMGNVDI